LQYKEREREELARRLEARGRWEWGGGDGQRPLQASLGAGSPDASILHLVELSKVERNRKDGCLWEKRPSGRPGKNAKNPCHSLPLTSI